ncbi:vacuolar protein sorting-associated protein 4B-like [Babylonia areolata]|uniref:vacuolar protein sorting-associated protein 4B-like n=1 Tax=Babylonia areolata TaxID=304850 RepID=UPI003FD0EE10
MMELASSSLMKTSLQHLQAGLTADCQGRYRDAAVAYMDGAPLLLQVAREEGVSTPVKQLLKSLSQSYLNRIQLIKTQLEAKEDVPPNKAVDRAHPNMIGELQEDSKEFLRTLSYQPFECNLEEVKGMTQAKEFLWKNVVLPLLFPGFPDSVTRVKKGILLYGLPGTGKTMLMCAVARIVSCPVFRVTATDLVSRWSGREQCLKRVKELFRHALLNQPCLVFVDDLEMICGPEKEGGIVGEVREEFFTQLREIAAGNQVTVIAATQKPWLLPGTLQRRFDRRFYLTLPSADERVEILAHHFVSIKHQLTEADFDFLGQMTSGYTGADLSVVVRSCSMAYVRTLQKATHFRKVTVSPDEGRDKTEQVMLVPCGSSEAGAIEITVEFLNPERLLEVPATRMTVEEELKEMRSSVCDADLQQMNQWHEKFGQHD